MSIPSSIFSRFEYSSDRDRLWNEAFSLLDERAALTQEKRTLTNLDDIANINTRIAGIDSELEQIANDLDVPVDSLWQEWREWRNAPSFGRTYLNPEQEKLALWEKKRDQYIKEEKGKLHYQFRKAGINTDAEFKQYLKDHPEKQVELAVLMLAIGTAFDGEDKPTFNLDDEKSRKHNAISDKFALALNDKSPGAGTIKSVLIEELIKNGTKSNNGDEDASLDKAWEKYGRAGEVVQKIDELVGGLLDITTTGTDITLDLLPIIGQMKALYELKTGANSITGEELTTLDKSLSIIGLLLPFIPTDKLDDVAGAISNLKKSLTGNPKVDKDTIDRIKRIEQALDKAGNGKPAESVIDEKTIDNVDSLLDWFKWGGKKAKTVLTSQHIAEITDWATKKEIKINWKADEFLTATKRAAGFDHSNGTILLKSNASWFEAYHEWQHAKHYVLIGADKYRSLHKYEREKYVFDRIWENRKMFTSDEIKNAIKQINDSYADYLEFLKGRK